MSKRNIVRIAREQFRGLNDTPNWPARPSDQARVLYNTHIREDGALEKSSGRSEINANAFANASSVILSPEPNFIVELTAANNTVKFKQGSTEYTATLAEGRYYTYASLGAALKAAMLAQHSAGLYDVSFSTSTRKFTITTGINGVLILRWYNKEQMDDDKLRHDAGNPTGVSGTINAALFGFRYNAKGGSAGSFASITSAFTVPLEPPYDVYVGGKTYFKTKDDVAITLPDASAPLTSDYKWSGVWFNKKCYLSNGREAYILRDNKYLRLYPKLPDVQESDFAVAGYSGLFFYTCSKAATSPLLKQPYRVPLKPAKDSGGTPHTDYVGVNHISIYLKAATAGLTIKPLYVYLEDTRTNYKELLKKITREDFGGASELLVEADITPNIFLNCDGGFGYLYLTIEQDEYTTDTNLLYGRGTPDPTVHSPASAQYLQYYNEDSGWIDDPANVNLAGTVSCLAAINTSIPNTQYWFRYKMSYENAEGFETNLCDAPISVAYYYNSIGASFLKNSLKVLPQGNFDYKWINIYRTAANAATYRLVGSYPNNGDDAINFSEGMSDILLAGVAEADTTVRDVPEPYIDSWFWDDKHWIVPTANQDTLYYSVADEPDHFDFGNQNNKIGYDGAPIKGIAPCGDRLLAFKQDSVWMIFPSGSIYAVQQSLQKGVGTNSGRSLVSAPTKSGNLIFFQAQNGHIYITDGYTINTISMGILEDTVAYLNKYDLDKTAGFYNPNTQEVIWSVCTGIAIAPNLNIIWHTELQSFYTDSFPAKTWAIDMRNTSYPNQSLPMGINPETNTLFYGYFADADYAAKIVSTYRTADLDFQAPFDYKNYTCLFLNMYAKSQKLVSIKVYADGESAPVGSYDRTITTTPRIYRIPIRGRGKYISVEIADNDSGGWWRLPEILIEYFPIYRAVS